MELVRRIGSATAATMVAVVLSCAGAQASTGTKARIALDQQEGLARGAVTGHGVGFDHWATDGVRRPPLQPPLENVWANADYVQVRWDSLDGAVVWEGAPDSSGGIRFAFSVPADAAPGVYTVVATQTGYDGRPTGGTPTRATFRVLAAPPPPSDARPAPSSAVDAVPGAVQRAPVVSRGRARPTRRITASSNGASPASAADVPAVPVAGAPAPAPATRPARAIDARRPTTPRAREASRSAKALAHVTRTRGVAPARERASAVRLAPGAGPATATPTRDDDGVPWLLLVAAGVLAALTGAAITYATRLPVRWSSSSPEDEPLITAPDAVERELRELLAQYEDDRVPELAGQR